MSKCKILLLKNSTISSIKKGFLIHLKNKYLSKNEVCTETKKIHEMRNKSNLMKKNQIELKKLLSLSMLVKFSFST